MRTKILLGAAILAAGIAASQAQNVYSVNVVGYVNIPVTNGVFALLGNPLAASPNNAVSNMLPITDPNFDGSGIFTYKNGQLTAVETFNALPPNYTNGAWSPGTNVLNGGAGFFFYPSIGNANPSVTTGTITFAGTVVTNSSITLVPGFNLVSSPFPASTNLVTLGLNSSFAQDGDTVFRYNVAGAPHPNTLNDVVTYEYFNTPPNWFDGNVVGGGPIGGPNLNVAEGFYYLNNSASDFGSSNYVWTQTFYVQ